MSEEADIFLPGREGYVVLDIESQGYVRFCPIEIALARFSPDGTLLDSYSTLVRPRVSRVSSVVTRLTGITTAMVRQAPAPREIMDTVCSFIGDSVIVGHDVGANDIPIIDHFSEAYYGKKLNCKHVDTLYWSRALFPGLEHYNLKALAEHFEVGAESYHRALDDCITNSRVYQRLYARAQALEPERRAALLYDFAHRFDAKEKKPAERPAGKRVKRPLNYDLLPVYRETKENVSLSRLAVLRVKPAAQHGRQGLELFVRGDIPQTEGFIDAHAECGWTAAEDGTYRAESLTAALLDKLGRVLRADGCRLYRAEDGNPAGAEQAAAMPRAFHYGRLPVLHEPVDSSAPGTALLRIGRLTSQSAKKCELRLRGEFRRVEALIESQSELGWTAGEEGTYRVRELPLKMLLELKSAVESDGGRLCRPETGERHLGAALDAEDDSGELPVEILPAESGYDVVFVDASRGIPAAWMEKQIGVRRESFFRFHVEGEFSIGPEEMRKRLARLGWKSSIRVN